jgi:hypothetical protein
MTARYTGRQQGDLIKLKNYGDIETDGQTQENMQTVI